MSHLAIWNVRYLEKFMMVNELTGDIHVTHFITNHISHG